MGITRPVEAHAALLLYQETEKAVFGDLGELNEGEEDLTGAMETKGRQASHEESEVS